MSRNKKYKKAMKKVVKTLRKDKSYYYGWQSNIAMSFRDLAEFTVRDNSNVPLAVFTEDEMHKFANKAAKNFLNLLIKK